MRATSTIWSPSSSGNLGIALAMASRSVGLEFTCVVDPTIARANLQFLRHLGGRIEMVHQRDLHGGYLHRRIPRVQTAPHRPRGRTAWPCH